MHALLHDMTWVEGLRSSYLTPLFQLLTGLGGTLFLLLFLIFGFLAIHRVVFARAIAIVLVSTIVGQWLKHYFQDPRPPQALWLDSSVGDSFGFPSGHAQVAVALWLWLAYHARQRWGAVLLAMIAAGIVFSRLYLGVHDVEDVLGGMTIGFIILVGFLVWSADRFADARERYAVVPLVAAIGLALVSVATWPAGDARAAMVLGVLLCGFWFACRAESRRGGPPRMEIDRVWMAVAGVVVGLVIALLAGVGAAPPMQQLPTVLLFGLYVGLLGSVLMTRAGVVERGATEPGEGIGS